MGEPVFPQGSLFAASIERIRYVSRDDGLFLFELTFSQQVIDLVKTYFDQIENLAMGGEDSEAMIKFLGNHLIKVIDHSARIEGVLVLNSPERFFESLIHRAALKASEYIKHTLGHAHSFHTSHSRPENGFNRRQLRKRERIENKFLQVEPIRLADIDETQLASDLNLDVDGGTELFAENLQLATEACNNPMKCIEHDKLLVCLQQYPLNGATSPPARPAMFELRRVYASIVDDCIRLLPEIKNSHFLSKVSIWPSLKWPVSYVLFSIFAIGMALLAPEIVEIFVPAVGKGFLEEWHAEIFFAVSFLAIFGYAHLEFGRRRGKVIDTLQRTAGVLEYGAILGSVVSVVAKNAGRSRFGDEPEIDQRGGVRIIDRRRAAEVDKRDRNKLILGIVIGIFALFFAFAEARGNISELFGWVLGGQ